MVPCSESSSPRAHSQALGAATAEGISEGIGFREMEKGTWASHGKRLLRGLPHLALLFPSPLFRHFWVEFRQPTASLPCAFLFTVLIIHEKATLK